MSVLAQLSFLRPWWLLALLPVIGISLFLLRSQDASSAYKRWVAPHLLKHLIIKPDTRKIIRPSQMFGVLGVLFIIALAGPSWRTEPSPFAEEDAGLMIVLRVSPSMKAEDLLPSRLERARLKLHDLFQLRTGGTSGLIAYSASAHLVMPLTPDTRIIEEMAASLDPSVMPAHDGDALVGALALTEAQFEKSKIAGSVLIVTDGISSTQVSALAEYRKVSRLGVQVLAVASSPPAADQAGIDRGARALDARTQLITVDDTDVRHITDRAESIVSEVTAAQEGSRRKDEGYAIVPVIAIGVLLWARRGWSVSWG